MTTEEALAELGIDPADHQLGQAVWQEVLRRRAPEDGNG